jgi:hypothetical protein
MAFDVILLTICSLPFGRKPSFLHSGTRYSVVQLIQELLAGKR